MKQKWTSWTAAAALALSLIANGCGDKGESSTPPQPGAAAAAPSESGGPEVKPSQGSDSEQGGSEFNPGQKLEREGKSQRQ